LEELLPLDDVEGIGAVFEEAGEGGEVVVVADVFEAVDFDDFGLEVGEFAGGAEEFDGFGEGDGGLDEDFGLFDEGGLDGFDVVGGEAFGEGVDVVDDGVEFADEGVDVFTVEGGDEGAVEAIEGLVGELIGVVLFLADAGDFFHGVGEIGGEGAEVAGAGDRVGGKAFEEVVEDRVLGEEVEHHPSRVVCKSGGLWTRVKMHARRKGLRLC
jgi:hypothetical protein